MGSPVALSIYFLGLMRHTWHTTCRASPLPPPPPDDDDDDDDDGDEVCNEAIGSNPDGKEILSVHDDNEMIRPDSPPFLSSSLDEMDEWSVQWYVMDLCVKIPCSIFFLL